jgi:peptidyl-tRNA hydrolase
MTDKTSPLASAISTPAATAPVVALLEGTFNGRAEFTQLVRDALATAAREGWRELLLCDASFEDWPLGERTVIESLQTWSKTGRKFTIVAKRFDTLIAKHHRFVTWRGQWSHIVQARGVPSADATEFPSAIYSPHWMMRRLDVARSKGVASSDAARRVMLREEINEWIGKSSPTFAATTLGL